MRTEWKNDRPKWWDTIRPATAWVLGLAGMVAIAAVDYLSGTELRVFPLYYAPISLIAWARGRRAAVVVSVLCGASWFVSNYVAGLHFTHAGLWLANTLVQIVSFATVGLLIATLRQALLRERGRGRTDTLTSMLNSRAFYEEAERLLAVSRRKMRPLTIAYLDIDNFKIINDTQGHQAGDALLRRVADMLRASIRPSDVAARIGGDEFAVLFPEVGAVEAAATLERLRTLLSKTPGPTGACITASVGGVTFVDLPRSVEELVKRADAQMYAAKGAGKNRIALATVASPAAASSES